MPAGVSAWTPLANITLGSNAATVTFSSISGSYRDLVLVAKAGMSSAGANLILRFNGDASGSYNWVLMSGSGSSTTYSSAAAQTGLNLNWNGTSGTPGSNFQRLDVMDYAQTNKHKTVLLRSDDVTSATTTEATVLRWAQTSAITQMTFAPNTGLIAAGSSFALYGVSS